MLGHHADSVPITRGWFSLSGVNGKGDAVAGFLGWIFVKSFGEAPWSQRWSLIGIVIAGLAVIFSARFILRSSFFRFPPGE